MWFVKAGVLFALIGGTLLMLIMFTKIFGLFGIPNYLGLVGDFVFTPRSKIQSFQGRTNLLILGKGGADHTAPDLTDSIMVASISVEKPSIVLISIPRDIWIPSIRAKVNSAYYWGKQKQDGGGIIMAKSVVEDIVGIPIHYGLVLDFSGFTKIIDVLGGVKINVEREFTDSKYPISGKENDACNGDKEYKCRYETITFSEGGQTMNGETALKFVRSRNAEGDEGTDIAREARQQKIILSIKNKALSLSTLLSPKKIISLYKAVKEVIESDVNMSVGAILVRRMLSSKDNLTSKVITEDYLVHPGVSSKYDNQYVYIPKAGDWSQVRQWVKLLLQ